MKISEKIDLYRKFNEGTEIEDAVKLLLDAASILDGISADHELALVMLTVEKFIKEYCELGIQRELTWEEYDQIDPELYKYILGGVNKLTFEQY